jgi:hypothetical protein
MVRMNRLPRIKSVLIVVSALGGASIIGCASSDKANIGDGELTVDKNALSSYAAEWTGYVEAHTFLSDNDQVRVTLDGQGNGWLQVGIGSTPPGPTDPAVGWPPVLAAMSIDDVNTYASYLFDGIRYPIRGARVELERIRLTVNSYDAYTAWCGLQTPMLHTDETPARYGCTAESGYEIPTGTNACATGVDANGAPIVVDCAKAVLCMGTVCSCDQSACRSGAGQDVQLDAALDDTGTTLVGTILMPDEAVGARTIRLKRVAGT